MSTNSKPITSINNGTLVARRNFIRDYLLSVNRGRGVTGKLTLLQLFEEARYLAEQLYPE